jgi:type IV pilus assembly protein PilQ
MKKGFFQTLLIIFLLVPLEVFSNQIKDINFIQEGEISKVIIEIEGDNIKAERFHITEDKQIILDVKNVKLINKLMRPIDTSEFSGSIVLVQPYQKPGSKTDIRLAIQLRDNVRSILEVNKNTIVLNVENRFGVFSKSKIKQADIDSDQAKVGSSILDRKVFVPKSDSIEDILENITMSGIKKYVGKKISISVKGVPVVDLLNYIADVSGFNIIIDQQVSTKQPLTLSLTNLPWDEVLDTILSLSKLDVKKHSNILMVTTNEKSQQDKKSEIRNQELNIKQESLVTKIFPISFSSLDDIIVVLQEYSTASRGKITKDDRTNTLIVKDTIEVIEKMKKIIKVLDTATPQILIEAKIVEANEEYSKDIGLKNGIQAGSYPNPNDAFLQDTTPDWSFSTTSNGTVPDGGAGIIGGTIKILGGLNNLSFDLMLMESESKGRVISTPKVITQNKKAASFSSSDQKRFRTFTTNVDGSQSPQTDTLDASLSLNVTPQVTNEGSISMEVKIDKTSFTTASASGELPGTATRSIETNVLVDNGSTIVIGGLYQSSSSETSTGIPFLKDLPLVGWLFKSSYNPSSTRNELIIFLTPRIINQEEAGLIDREQTIDT